MKKILGKIAVLVMALALVFSLAACGNDDSGNNDKNSKPITTTQLLNGSVDAMLAKNGFAIDGEVSINFNNELIKGIDMDLSAIFNKASNDYNYKMEVGSQQMMKVGNKAYLYSVENDNWLQEDAEILPPEVLKAQLLQYTSLLEEVPNKAENGGYVISSTIQLWELIQQFKTEIIVNKDKTLAEYVASKLGNESYTAEKLIEDIEAILGAENSVAESLNAIDAALNNMGASGITVKALVDAVAEGAELTAQDIYAMIIADDEEAAEEIPAPNPGETVYDYVVRVFGDMPLSFVVEIITDDGYGNSQTVEEFCAEIVETLEENTVKALWDNIAQDFDTQAIAYLSMLGASQEILNTITADGDKPVFCTDNLADFSFNKLDVEVKVEFNGDKTLKAVNINGAIDVTYDNQKVVKVEAAAKLTVKYTGVETIVAPAADKIVTNDYDMAA